MPISRAQPADLPALAELFAGYLDFYQVPRPLPEVTAFLAALGSDAVRARLIALGFTPAG